MTRRKAALLLAAIVVLAGALTLTSLRAPGRKPPSAAVSGAGAGRRVLASASLLTPMPAAAKVTASTQPAPQEAVTLNIQPGADSESQILEAVYLKVNPSVVQIINMAQSTRLRAAGAVPQGQGSGFVWDKLGHIVTNDHVVSGADKLQVIFADGTQADSKLVGTDPNGDIAVIQVDPELTALVPIEVGDMGQVKVGQMAIAIGNRFGFEGTMTRGIVSALGRSIPSQTRFSIPEAIQTDASINPGNSGGPLLNERGQVIGVCDQIQSASGSNSGVGFAIPINLVQRIVPSLIEYGSYEHSYLGVNGGTFTKAWAKALGLPAELKGVFVFEVAAGGPAEGAGLRGGSHDTEVLLGADLSGPSYLQSGGDLITAIDGQPLRKMDDLLIYLEEWTSPGQTASLKVMASDGQTRTLRVMLRARPA